MKADRRALRVLLAPQEFKGSLTARRAADAMAEGARQAGMLVELDILPLSDGGPGLVEVLVFAQHGELRSTAATDPLGRPIRATYGLLNDGRTAVVELSAASGLSLLSDSELDPLHASTYGTGQVISAALDDGVKEIIIGIGGSATNDGGAGMVEALGGRFLDEFGAPLPRGGAALATLSRIDLSGLDTQLKATKLVGASDVRNLLCGPDGASAVYGPQKGATPAMVEQLDSALRRYADVLRQALGTDVASTPGAGAAGGAGAALLGPLGATLRPGFSIVAEVTHLRQRIGRAQLVITGEGSLDRQTAFGKAVAGVAELASAQGVPVFALAGILRSGYEELLSLGITAAFSIVPGPVSLDDARSHAAEYLRERTCAVLRAFTAGLESFRPETLEGPS